jgi:hypothetical protein
VWLGAVVTAVVIALATTLSQQLLKSAQTVINRPTGDAITVRALQLERRPSDSFLFEKPLDLTDADLEAMNAATQNATAPAAFDDWARAHGGAADDYVNIKLVLEGNRDQPIRILDMVPLKTCRDPYTGTLVYSPSAGADSTVRVGLDLDQPVTVARSLHEGQWGGPYFQEKTVSLTRGEQQAFEITAQTIRYACEFTLQFTVLDGSQTITQVVSDHGKPFRVSAIVSDSAAGALAFSRYAALYVGGVGNPDGTGKFVRADPATFHE